MTDWCTRQRKAKGLDADKITKTFTCTGSVEFIERLDRHIAFIAWLGAVGHSTTAGIPVDGDGADRLVVKEDLPKIKEADILVKGTYPDEYERVV